VAVSLSQAGDADEWFKRGKAALARERRRPNMTGANGFLFTLPFFAGFALVFLVPFVYALVESLYAERRSGAGLGGAVRTFVGLDNFALGLGDTQFWSAVLRVGAFAVVQIPIMLGLSLLAALLLDMLTGRRSRFFRLGLLIPYMIPAIVAMTLGFGPAQYFAAMLFGLIASATIGQGAPIKGVAMVVLGLLLGTIGADVNTGVIRFNFGYFSLYDGISPTATGASDMRFVDVFVQKLQQEEAEADHPLPGTFESRLNRRLRDEAGRGDLHRRDRERLAAGAVRLAGRGDGGDDVRRVVLRAAG
jgi:hypothetical protein